MSEAQAFVALTKFLFDQAETQFRTNLSGGSRGAVLHVGLKQFSTCCVRTQHQLQCVTR